ncbi:MAG: 1-acyl-sn-glycerol-3-phosphate acyltransferase [Anaerolineaceae bacterium]|nr:1-acyl-sn-glycerol-3-phosphate acyltransferase [Anaerolineaceae bacterium]
MKRNTLKSLVNFLINVLAPATFEGVEQVPKEGGMILATNHFSRIDIPLLFINPARPDITALVTDKYLDYPFLRWFTNTAEGIWLDRTKADFKAFREASNVLKNDGCLAIAPEGTRSQTGVMIEGKPGSVLLAVKNQVPMVPVALMGTETMMANLKRFKRSRLTVRFGKPFMVPEMGRDNRDEILQETTTEIMCQIAALMPEKYHGFYDGHPRLKEILAEKA